MQCCLGLKSDQVYMTTYMWILFWTFSNLAPIWRCLNYYHSMKSQHLLTEVLQLCSSSRLFFIAFAFQQKHFRNNFWICVCSGTHTHILMGFLLGLHWTYSSIWEELTPSNPYWEFKSINREYFPTFLDLLTLVSLNIIC